MVAMMKKEEHSNTRSGEKELKASKKKRLLGVFSYRMDV